MRKTATDITITHNVNVKVFAKDLSVIGTISLLIEETGISNILVNNAGAMPRGSLELIDEERWRDYWNLRI